MKQGSKRSVLAMLFVLGILTWVNGCAVLTQSQINEVDDFAKASKQYTDLPGSLAQSYGILLRDSKLLSLSRYEYGKVGAGGGVDTARSKHAWEELNKAYSLEVDFNEVGRRMDAALKILKDYSDILSDLVSDKYGDTLGNNAVELGESMDKAVDSYNKSYPSRAPLTKVGGYVGSLVRGAGGIYIRHRQAEILRDTIEKANPLVESLMNEVELIASNFMEDLKNYEKSYLRAEFMSVANNSQRIDFPTVALVYEDLKRVKTTATLADQVAKAARTYKEAHAQLVANTRQRKDLDSVIEKVKALEKEVQAAQKVKKAIGD